MFIIPIATFDKTFKWNHDCLLSFRFINNKIVSVYCTVLKTYSTNSDELNNAIVKMLHRVAVKHKMTAMLFQISVFTTMLSILQEPPVPRFKVNMSTCTCRHLHVHVTTCAIYIYIHVAVYFENVWTSCLFLIKFNCIHVHVGVCIHVGV